VGARRGHQLGGHPGVPGGHEREGRGGDRADRGAECRAARGPVPPGEDGGRRGRRAGQAPEVDPARAGRRPARAGRAGDRDPGLRAAVPSARRAGLRRVDGARVPAVRPGRLRDQLWLAVTRGVRGVVPPEGNGGGNGTLLIRSRRMVVDGEVREGAALVRDGRIEAVGDYGLRVDADRTVDLGDLPLLPGVVDSHVHVNEPGRTEWEGFATATRAALAGGVTTICDMPLNSLPPTVDVDALRAKVAAAAGQCAVDVAFWGGAIPGNADK